MSMKRTYERILFMVIGALIAFFAYLLGGMDNPISAKEYQDPEMGNVIICDRLFVRNTAIVGNPDDTSKSITLSVDDERSALLLSHENIDDKSNIILMAKNDGSDIFASYKTKGANSSYTVTANSKAVESRYLCGRTILPESIMKFRAENNGLTTIKMESSIGNGGILDFETSRSAASFSISDANGDKKINTLKQ